MSDIDNLSNKELLVKCREYGLPVVPVTDSTRNVIIRRLQSAILKKTNKSANTVVPKNQNSSRKTISANKVRHGQTNSKNIISQKRQTIDTKRRTMPSRKTVSESASQVEIEDCSKGNEDSPSVGSAVVSVTSFIHEVDTSNDGDGTDDDAPTLNRKSVRFKKESQSQANHNKDSDAKADFKRRSLPSKGRSTHSTTMVSDAGWQTDLSDSGRETNYRKKEIVSQSNQDNDASTKTNLKRRSIQVTGRTTTTASNLSSKPLDDDYSHFKQTPLNKDVRSKRIQSLTKSEVVTTSYIHQIETSCSNKDEDNEVIVQQSNPGKRRRICTSPVSCPPPIYESGFSESFAPAPNVAQSRLTQTQLKTTSYLDVGSNHNSPSTSHLLSRSSSSGSYGSFDKESSFSIRKRRIVESSLQPTVVNTLYPNLDQFYKPSSPRETSRGEPMETDSTWDLPNTQTNSIQNSWRYL